jgi:hypothetical protein
MLPRGGATLIMVSIGGIEQEPIGISIIMIIVVQSWRL